jgi:hypothetical protein
MNKCVAVITSLLLIFSTSDAAHGIAAARPEDILCHASQVVVAQVLGGKLTDCRLQHPKALSCYPKNVLHFSIRVDEILGSTFEANSEPTRRLPRSGDIVEIDTEIYNEAPSSAGGTDNFPSEEYGRLKVRPGTGRPLTDQEILDQFVGKSFVFGIQQTLWASAWPTRLREWIDNTLRRSDGRSCPKAT